MDINRPFGDGLNNNDTNAIDEPGNLLTGVGGEETLANNRDALDLFGDEDETEMDLNYDGERNAADAAPLTNPRQIFARHLYMLAMLKLNPIDDFDGDGMEGADGDAESIQDNEAFAKAIAQWAVNVVDFRDPDSIHTRFIYDPTPFDAGGWNPTINADSGEPTGTTGVVWGAERPELLLTETLAVHIQNTEMADSGFEQRLRPESFAYFEIYNPWTQNRLNQPLRRDPTLYTRFGVDLTRTSDNGSPVWRFEVLRDDSTEDDPTIFKPLRYVYTTDPGDSITYTGMGDDDVEGDEQVEGDIEVFFSSGGQTLLRPGRQAVIGTQGFEKDDKFEVYMGRRTGADDQNGTSGENLMLDQTTRLAFSPNRGPNPGMIERYTASDTVESTRSAMVVFIDQATTVGDGATGGERKFSLSDPYEGYPDTGVTEIPDGDGAVFAAPRTNPLEVEDGDRLTDRDVAMIRSEDGTNKNFRLVRLQRLANPLQDWNAITNPYLTIDSMEVDLVSINGADPVATPPTAPDPFALGSTPTSSDAVSLERGEAARSPVGFPT